MHKTLEKGGQISVQQFNLMSCQQGKNDIAVEKSISILLGYLSAAQLLNFFVLQITAVHS